MKQFNNGKKTAMITGIAGMVGSHLADYLLTHTDLNVVGFLRWNEEQDNLEHLFPEINRAERLGLFVTGRYREKVSSPLIQIKVSYLTSSVLRFYLFPFLGCY